MTGTAFDFLALSSERSWDKPRATGRTMVFDMGIGPATLNDSLQVLGPFIDLAKIAVGSSRLYERELMLRKVEISENAGVKPFLGA